MIELPTPPTLTQPSARVMTSYLVAEQADMLHRGSDTEWLREASVDFDGFVSARVGVRERWGVPSELFWFTAHEYYIGSLVIRHRLTADEGGGHIGYHASTPGNVKATRRRCCVLPSVSVSPWESTGSC